MQPTGKKITVIPVNPRYDYKAANEVKKIRRAAYATEDAIIEFCTEQRTRKELVEHFGLTEWTTWTYINPLIKSGKLNLTSPNSGVTNSAQRYTSRGANT